MAYLPATGQIHVAKAINVFYHIHNTFDLPQVVLMPPEELGNPAHSKTDLEVWLPGRGFYGELTSASNCTDYQAKRLSISYTNNQGESRFGQGRS